MLTQLGSRNLRRGAKEYPDFADVRRAYVVPSWIPYEIHYHTPKTQLHR